MSDQSLQSDSEGVPLFALTFQDMAVVDGTVAQATSTQYLTGQSGAGENDSDSDS